MTRKAQRLRNATTIEIDRRIRSAGDHIGALIQHERVVAESAESNAIETELDARRRFDRDLQAFFAAARTARNYLIQKTDEVGQRGWLEIRLEPKLFEFHAALANQDMHDHAAVVAKTYDVSYAVRADVVRLVDGGRAILIPSDIQKPKYTRMRLTYVEADLEPAARDAYQSLKDGPQGPRGVIELAGEYIQGLREIVRDAERDGLFSAVGPT
ncbi:MAG TPA: hypothetical protein VMD91_10585 [Candidatus Sulfotelmatobacter sp.]|nr:hypothetical protein [Candidatus Sulfotelmatobacter sp.]